jgi:hypothetical protein
MDIYTAKNSGKLLSHYYNGKYALISIFFLNSCKSTNRNIPMAGIKPDFQYIIPLAHYKDHLYNQDKNNLNRFSK